MGITIPTAITILMGITTPTAITILMDIIVPATPTALLILRRGRARGIPSIVYHIDS
jgi:hypothetical protein